MSEIYNQDPNANLREAVFLGNEQNTAAINNFANTATQLTDRYNTLSGGMAKGANQDMSNAYGGYQDRSRNLLNAYGTADQDMLSRYKGNAYAGLDSGFQDANNSLNASLAQRGLSGSGVQGQALGDLAQMRMRAGAEAGTRAHGDAIGASDARRSTQLSGEGNLYGAQQNMLLGNYGRSAGVLGQQYGTTMGVQGQNLQNQLNDSQQRQANLMGYAQLGRGMSGMANNYLAQSGTGYGNIGSVAGQTALGLGSNATAYNTGMNNAQAGFNDSSSGVKGGLTGMAGELGGAYLSSDERLKENIEAIDWISDGIMLYKWDWNDEAKDLVGNQPAIGVIAQEVQEVMPEAVKEDPNSGYLTVNYSMVFKGA